MRLPQVAWCVVLGILPLIGLPQLPGLMLIKGVIVLAVLLLFCRAPAIKYSALTLLFFCWGCLAAHQTLWPVNALTGKNQQAEVVITATDGQTTHQGKIVRLNGKRQFPSIAVSLYGNYLPQPACAGQRWDMTLRMRPVHGQLNEGGFDSQRTALVRHTAISGRFLSATALDATCSWRARYLSSLTESLAQRRWQPVILALGAGERTTLPVEVKRLLQQTGTSHLMAISGLHIALVASLGWLLVRALQFFLPCRYINWRAPLVAGFGCALCYALFTGLQPPALRTIAALAILYGLRLRGRRWSPWSVWICCVGAIVFSDPLAILSQSLWLSAFAVAALIFWYQWMPFPAQSLPLWGRWLAGLLHLQLGLMLLLMPLQVALFHGISLSSIVANLLAVPVVTFAVVPLILTGMLLHLIGPAIAKTSVWWLTDRILALLFGFLARLPDGWLSLDARWLPALILPWLGLIAWKLGGWKSVPAICLTATAVLTYPLWPHKPSDDWRVTMLDVGQGLAMVIDRHDKAILYDTGLAWPGGDSGQQLIIPWLRWHHLQPEGIILSHEHLDHRGGLDSLARAWPQVWIRSPLEWSGHQSCFRGDSWQWEGLTFRVLWPLTGAQTQGNNRSCVVRVDDGKYSILLTGDIELSAEFSMLSHYWQHLTSTLIQVPHHGSSTSSGIALLQRVGGQAALASASRYNAWHLPSVKVVKRYRQQGYQWYDTPHQGQISVLFQHDNWQIRSLRDQIFPRWYHQWFGVSRDNG
ncbi:ComEC family protein [Trabulsiella odontotermitis]|uniref:Competence protein ComEC n=1 Tax=Trabulsiella odontotermitis TaxID=379893 RepID=A0A0L0GZL6_9ENTR|nr:ComEC family protein [Trabulsiella odontotermitis]KNC94131.1 competence protein ComEC [Trabulsiella odontotermitis]